jgi:hypothetical protein
LRYYTEDDYVNGVPCIYRHGGTQVTVRVLSMSERHKFDNGRELTVRFPDGHVAHRNIGGSDLTQVLYAM